MSFSLRAAVSLLSGIGAGTLTFGIAWKSFIVDVIYENPGRGYDHMLAGSMFLAGIATSVTVFMLLSRSSEKLLAACVPVQR
jgi:hypothetical protein